MAVAAAMEAAGTPVAVPTIAGLPGPVVPLDRSFRYGPVKLTILDRQVIADRTSSGVECSQLLSQVNLALRLKIENTAPHPYELDLGDLRLTDAQRQPLRNLSEGTFAAASGGVTGLQMDLEPNASLEAVICATFDPTADPAAHFVAVGTGDEARIQVPLAQEGPSELGVYLESPLAKTITFKGAEITFSKAILTSGVWDNLSTGQAENGMLWLLLPTDVKNNSGTYLFIEDGEVRLEVGDQVLEPQLDTQETYQAAPYGLEEGLTAKGSLLFAVPENAGEAVLRLKSSSPEQDITVPIALPAR